MQFNDVIASSGAKASVMTTPTGVIFSIPADLAERAGINAGYDKGNYVKLQYGRDGEEQAVQLVPSATETAWKVQRRKLVVQVHAKQIKPKTSFPKTALTHQIGSQGLILALPSAWDMPDVVVDQASTPRKRP